MSSDKFATTRPIAPTKALITVWILTLLMSLMAFVSIVGSFLFAFPMGGSLGVTAGTLLIMVGMGYGFIVSRLCRGERTIWIAALIVPIVHTLGLNTLDLVLYGAIPSEDDPFMGVALACVVLLLLPTIRRFFVQ